jgi:hypothetical protein
VTSCFDRAVRTSYVLGRVQQAIYPRLQTHDAWAQGRIGVSETNPSEASSQTDGILRVQGLGEPVGIARDAFGVAHIRAATEHDAWFGQGFASAQDRAWQMEYDRRRATGRWVEVAGPAALAGDRLSRRLQLTRAAKADVARSMADTARADRAWRPATGASAFAALHRDRRSPLAVSKRFTRVGPFTGEAEQARTALADWDGNLLPEAGQALLCTSRRRRSRARQSARWSWHRGTIESRHRGLGARPRFMAVVKPSEGPAGRSGFRLVPNL